MFFSPHFKLPNGYGILDSITQNKEKKNNSMESCLKILHRVFKFIIAHHYYVIIVYFWFLILSYGIYRRPIVI